MKFASLRFRLALWYFCTVAVLASLIAAGSWYAMWLSLDHALDVGLDYRLLGLRQFLENCDTPPDCRLGEKLREISTAGESSQVFDDTGRLIAQSPSLARRHLNDRPPSDLGQETRYRSGGTQEFPVRLAAHRVIIGGVPLIIEAVDPQGKFEFAAREYKLVLWFSLPAVLALATLCGLWLSRRALAPVDRITENARAITASTLSARLPVLHTHDELQRLSETLNGMLDRIEGSFIRIRQFTADASHELRAPLTLIYTAAQYSLRRERNQNDLIDSMQKILREAKRTTVLVDDLLMVARGDTGPNGAELRRMDALPLLREIADEASTLAAGKDIGVNACLTNEALPVRANDPSLRRLLLILIDNAIKYTAAGGKIRLETRNEGRDVVISVADTGPGIAAEDLPHIFERFWRADTVRSRESCGAGLGLTIAKQIADQHAGDLTVISTVGKGSIFSLRLPKAS